MGYFYFDESKHIRGEFVLGAFLYSSSPVDEAVAALLEQCGLTPGVDEFKSGARIPRDDTAACLVRDRLRHGLHQLYGQIGVVVAPLKDMDAFQYDILHGLKKIINENDLRGSQHQAFFDEGVFVPPASAQRICDEIGLTGIDLHPSEDSRLRGGIQVADLAAHTLATMLLAQLGIVTKTVKAGDSSGYDPDLDIELDFELWARLRYNMFKRPPLNAEGIPDPANPDFDSTCGLLISDRAPAQLSKAALDRFGSVYLGCVH